MSGGRNIGARCHLRAPPPMCGMTQSARWLLAGFVGMLCAPGTARAHGIQAQCGGMQGTAYFAEQGLAQGANAGWQQDALTNAETIIRIDTDTGSVDLRFKDSTGVWQTPADQGGAASLFAVQSEPPTFGVVVTYPGATVESYTIAEIQYGRARLIHTQARTTANLTNGRLMTGQCLLTSF